MKQVLQNLRTGETTIAEVPVPSPKPGTALVRTAASLVSAGTERMLVEFAEKSLLGKARSRPDLARQVLEKARREGLFTTIEAAFNRLDQPLPLGYSSSGVIVSLGVGMTGFSQGDRVACAGGGYAVHAEYAVVPRNLLAVLPPNVDFESAAFTTLGAIALHGFRLAGAQLGERVAVIGLGLLGLLATGIANAAGCRVLGVDIDPHRVKLAQAMGGMGVARRDAEEAARVFSAGRGVDAVLICADTSSADPVELAGIIARDRARVVAVGAVGQTLPRKIYYEKELFFVNSRSYGPGRYDKSYEEDGQDYPPGYVRWTEGRNLEAFVELLANGQLDVKPLISHRFAIEQAEQAYRLITGRSREAYLGVLLTYGEASERSPSEVTAETASPSPVERSFETVRAPKKIERVRLGVLGSGNFATAVMLPALKKIAEVDLIGIASSAGLSAQHAAARYGFLYAVSEEQRILEDSQINTVAVLTRHDLHPRLVLAALSKGKHVFCEKPLALSLDELEQIEHFLTEQNQIQMAEQASAAPLLMVGFNRRFAPLAQRLAEFFQGRQEPLVALYRVNAGYLPLSHWLHDSKQGGGRIVGEACHFIDFLTFLVGQPPTTVIAQGLPDMGRYREDNVILNLCFPDGSLGSIAYLANGDKSFPKERVEVYCGGRVGVLDDFRSLELVRDGRRRRLSSRLRQDKGHLGEWQVFVRSLLDGGPPPISYDHLFGVVRAALAAVQSLRTGNREDI